MQSPWHKEFGAIGVLRIKSIMCVMSLKEKMHHCFRTTPLVGLFVQARNLALNLYREYGWTNMAQAQRRCSQSLELLMDVFRMK